MSEDWEKPGTYRVLVRIRGTIEVIEIAARNMADAKRRARANGHDVVDNL